MSVAHRLDRRTKEKRGRAHAQLWNVVDGAVVDAFKRHPDYLTEKGHRAAPLSIVKRVTGTVLGFALQEARRQRELAAMQEAGSTSRPEVSGAVTSDAGAGVNFVSPSIHRVRIVNVRFKRRSRYRSPQSFNLTTDKLRKELGRGGQ